MNAKMINIKLKEESKKLYNSGLVLQDFGNISMKIQDKIIIKASGRPMDSIEAKDFVMVDSFGKSIKSNLRPSSDTPSHIEIYNNFEEIKAVIHTHSPYATAWAQSGKSIPCLGTTHADHWCVDIPITRALKSTEIHANYEAETGKVIVEKIKHLKVNPLHCPGILVLNHGPFVWGKNLIETVKNAEILEYLAKIAYMSLIINPNSKKLNKTLWDRHFLRKNGNDAYYGQQSLD